MSGTEGPLDQPDGGMGSDTHKQPTVSLVSGMQHKALLKQEYPWIQEILRGQSVLGLL